jgi:putative transposase
MPYLARRDQLIGALVYHVFNRGNGKREIFHAPRDYERFKEILVRYSTAFGIRLFHWALMPNHYHLLMQLNEPERLSAVMAGIARSYVFYHHTTHRTVGHLWQGRFKSQPIERDTYLLACGRYIERNPVEAGIVAAAEEYPNSSASYYVSGRADGLTHPDPLFPSFAEDLADRRKNYKEFLSGHNPEEDRFFENLEKPMGSEEFLKRLARKRGHYLPKRGRPVR